MWLLLALLSLPPLGSGVPLHTRGPLEHAGDTASHGPQPPRTSPAPPVTPTLLPTHSEAPALSLNLGLNFKIKVRSQGKGRPGEGPGGASTKPGQPPTRPAAPTHSQAPGSPFWAEALGGSGWPAPGPAEELPSGPGGWAWEGSPAHATPGLPATPGGAPQPPLLLWPGLAKGALGGSAGEHSKELEFKIDIDLTAGLGKESGPAPNGTRGSGGAPSGKRYALLPGLHVGLSGAAGELRPPGLFGATEPPGPRGPAEWGATGSSGEQPGDGPPTPAWSPRPGLESSSLAPSPGGGGTSVALPGCPPEHAEDCSSPLPEPGASPLTPRLLLALPLLVPLHSDWDAALAEWGRAWQAHIYGAGCLFALLALLALLGLLGLACRCPAGCRLLAWLQALLVAAGGPRAALLFGDACGQLERLPGFAVRLLQDLPLPGLTSALAVALLLLSLRPRAGLSARAGPRQPCWLAPLLLLHFSVAAGAVLAADLLHRLPFLLLAARGLFALLAALLSACCLALCCVSRADAVQVYDLKSPAPPAGPSPFAEARLWRRAARMALLAALFGLLSAGVHTYAILHALGFGLRPVRLGPWPWWALQLACRLCEAGMGLPLACLGLLPVFCAPPGARCPCGARLPCLAPAQAVARAQAPPNHFQWALSGQEKLVLCDTIACSDADYLPLYALPAEEEPGQPGGAPSTKAPSLLSIALEAGDPTADFQPPSPIDLRRSIDEALCSEGLLRGGAALYAPSPPALSSARRRSPESGLYCTASCMELLPAWSQTEGETSQETSGPPTTLSSPGPWRGSPRAGSPCGLSTDSGSRGLCSSPGRGGSAGTTACASPPESPAAPGCPYWALTPISQGSPASAGQREARASDALSVASETIDL